MIQDVIMVFITAANKTQAEQLAQALVEKRLAACCNIIDPITSIFHWQSQTCHEQEVLMILKTVANRFDELVVEVKKQHSYETPEIIAVPLLLGTNDYLEWVRKETEWN
ncbi:MAG: divalent-cation tolerance protein CutA [candidate division KSB1 bacterium]|nr:divalent-cation tolerance protein CutA [candidate division KSB1 bacterium]MDZ7318301.1 divalent-cation tolerance protein CutA [candidate division KSB1 bacterium]MDZ7342449.1 divalent-cation tolerance protein CutA [candidate division KSB1 bacterium]